MSRHVFLIGHSGAGKTAVVQHLDDLYETCDMDIYLYENSDIKMDINATQPYADETADEVV